MLPLAPRGHIILDSIETWPTSIRDILASEEVQLRSYVEAERMYEERLRDDVMLRLQPWANPYESGWQEAAGRVRELAEAYPVVGFHCTRLTRDEIDDVRSNGLRPLSPCFTSQRVDRRVRDGLISPRSAHEFKAANETTAGNRRGMIWFFHCLSTLRDEGAIYRLFRSWGGESIYCRHETNWRPHPVLSRIGTPCIVVATLQPSDVGGLRSFEERLILVWLDRNRANAYSHDCDTRVQNRVVPVLEVIEYADPRFEQLTGCSQWSQPLGPQ